MESHSYYNKILKEFIEDCKNQYGNIYGVDNTYKPQDFINEYVLHNNDRANELIKILSNGGEDKAYSKDLKLGLIDILKDELNKYKKILDNTMDISGGRGGSGRYKKSSKTKKNI
jgi:hypothetical protein